MSEPEEILLVTVAPYETITVSPHPSGIPGMPPLVLRGGDTLRVSLSEAERLYQQRKVVGLKSGKVKPPDPPAPPSIGPTISYGNGPPIPFSDPGRLMSASMMASRAEAERAEAEEEAKRIKRNAEREAKPHRWERPAAVRVGGQEFSLDPLGPLPGITPEEGGWA